MSGMDREKQHGDYYTPVAKPVHQSPNDCATTLRSECRISLGILPVTFKKSKSCLETCTLLDTGSNVNVVQRAS